MVDSDPKPVKELTSFPVPELLDSQLDRITSESARVQAVREFDPERAHRVLRQPHNQHKRIFTIEMGGNNLHTLTWELGDYGEKLFNMRSLEGSLKRESEAGYMDLLEKIAQEARTTKTPVAISFAGQVDGTKPKIAPNLPVFRDVFEERYGSDFANLFEGTRVYLANDAVAALTAGIMKARKFVPRVNTVILDINGTGNGGAIWKNGVMMATEIGHVELNPPLNPYWQTKPCGQFGQQFVCLERVAASGAGIQDIWSRETGESLDGRQIAQKFYTGDRLATELYDDSAEIMAHELVALAGLPEVDALGSLEHTLFVHHGGIYEVVSYAERVDQIIEAHLGRIIRSLCAKDIKPTVPGLKGAMVLERLDASTKATSS